MKILMPNNSYCGYLGETNKIKYGLVDFDPQLIHKLLDYDFNFRAGQAEHGTEIPVSKVDVDWILSNDNYNQVLDTLLHNKSFIKSGFDGIEFDIIKSPTHAWYVMQDFCFHTNVFEGDDVIKDTGNLYFAPWLLTHILHEMNYDIKVTTILQEREKVNVE